MKKKLFIALALMLTLCVVLLTSCDFLGNNPEIPTEPNGENTNPPTNSETTPPSNETNQPSVTPSPEEENPLGYTEGLEYELNKETNTYTVTGIGTAKVSHLIIPETYNGLVVDKIGEDAFFESTIISAYLPDSIKTIGKRAFSMCMNLKEVRMSNNLESVDDWAFSLCVNLNYIVIPQNVTLLNSSAFVGCVRLFEIVNLSSIELTSAYVVYNSLQSQVNKFITDEGYEFYEYNGQCYLINYYGDEDEIILPSNFNGKDYIIAGAFCFNNTIKSVVIPDGVTEIKAGSFTFCKNLFSVDIAGSVKKIQSYTFCRMGDSDYEDNLTRVILREGISSISEYAFCYPDKIVEIYNLTSLDIVAGSDEHGSIARNAKQIYTSLDIPSKVIKTEDDFIFYNDNENYSLLAYVGTENDIELPSNINGNKYVIAEKALSRRTSLNGVVISNGVTSIGSYAFNECSSLTSITIPNSVTSIGNLAFYNCSNLTSITIGENITSIGISAFRYCYKLVEVYNLSSLTIIAGLWEDNGCVGYYAKVVHTSLDTPSRLSTTEDGYIVYADSVNNEYSLIGYVGNETILTLPSDINGNNYSINQYAFYNNDNITSVTIPNSVTSIGEYAFSGCTALTEINFNATAMNDLSSNNNVFDNAGKGGSGIVVNIGANVTKIPAYLFYGGGKITRVVFDEGCVCESIGNYAFYNRSSLTSITIPENVTSIGSWAFVSCHKLVEVYNLSSLTITAGSNDNGGVGYYAKNVYTDTEGERKLTTEDGYVIYSDSVNNEYYLMGYVGNETILTLPSDINGNNYSIYQYAFCYNTNITSVTIPDSVTSIGRYAFDYCSSLTKVNYLGTIDQWAMIEFGDEDANPLRYADKLYINDVEVTEVVLTTATKISNYAFIGCSSITSVTISESVTSIGSSAFYHCSSLTSVTIGEDVTSIGADAFWYCYSLTSLNYEGTVAEWQAISLGYNWNHSTGNYIIYCTDGQIAKDGTVTMN